MSRFGSLAKIYVRYASLKGWSTRKDVVREKIAEWEADGTGTFALAATFHETGVDQCAHLGFDAGEVAVNSSIQTLSTTVAGTGHRNRDGSWRTEIAAQCERHEQVRLKREPENEFDANAVAVLRRTGGQFGYLRMQDAEIAVERLAKGQRMRAVVRDILPFAGITVTVDLPPRGDLTACKEWYQQFKKGIKPRFESRTQTCTVRLAVFFLDQSVTTDEWKKHLTRWKAAH